MPDLSAPGEVVSTAEADFFMKNGFLVKNRLLDPGPLGPALDRIWSHMLEQVPTLDGSGWTLSREDAASWMNPQWAPMPPHPVTGPFLGRQPIEHYGRTVKMHDIGAAAYLVDLVPNNRLVRSVAEALLSEDLRPSTKTRGVYALFPTRNPADPSGAKRLRGASLGPHTDQVCQQLNACAYLEDVPPRGGSFTVYPGSHKLMFQAHQHESNWSPLPSYDAVMANVLAEIEPLELIGDQGAVIFWHGRTVHSSGIHIGDNIRWAVFADFTENREVLSDAEHKHLGQYEWFKDTKLFKDDPSVGRDMWHNWNVAKISSTATGPG